MADQYERVRNSRTGAFFNKVLKLLTGTDYAAAAAIYANTVKDGTGTWLVPLADSDGHLQVDAKDGGPSIDGTPLFTSSADMSTAADIGPAPVSGQKSRLRQLSVSCAVAMEFTIQMETTAGTERYSWFLPASGSLLFIPRYQPLLGTADKKWQGKASVAGNVRVSTVTTSEA